MEELLNKLENKAVTVNGIKVVPLSLIRHELENYQIKNVKDSLEHIQTDVKAILDSLQNTSKQILND